MSGATRLREIAHIRLASVRAMHALGGEQPRVLAAVDAAARGDIAREDAESLLSAHLEARERCIAVLSGHTHGTQLDLPLLRRAGPAHPGLRVPFGPTTLIVSRGLGAIGLPLRWGAPAEVVIVNVEPV